MDYMKNAQRLSLGEQTLNFIRCDGQGNELSPETLAQMNFSNSVIARLVTQTAGRLGAGADADGEFADGFTTL